MIKLIQFFPLWGLPNASPFCMKLETYLKMTTTPYKNQYTANPKHSPTGKFPVIEDNGKKLADSSLIIDHLKSTYGDSLDAHLTPAEQAHFLGLQRLLEEHLYWCVVYSRWLDPDGWAIANPAFFGKLPLLLKWWLPSTIRKKVSRQLNGQGLGLLSKETIYQLGKKDLQALADCLADKAFFGGEKPISFDAIAFAMLANIIYPPIDSPLKQYALTIPTFKQYCERMFERYYKENHGH